MSWRQVAVLVVILVALVSMLFVKDALFKPPVERTLYARLGLSIDPSAVTRIEIRKGEKDEPFVLEKRGGAWTVLGPWSVAGSSQKIDYLIQGLLSLNGELRADSAALFDDFGISSSQAFSVTFVEAGGKRRKTLLVGSKRPGSGATFVREDGSNKVYLVNNDLLGLIGIYGDPKTARVDRESWFDLSLFSFDPNEVDAITIVRPEPPGPGVVQVGLKRELDKEKNLMRWVSTAGTMPFDIDAAKIKAFLVRLKGAYATKAMDPSKGPYGFEPGTLTVAVSAGSGKKSELVLGAFADGEKKERYARSSNGLTAIVSPFVVADDLDIDTSRFFVDNPLKFDESAVSSVEISSDGVTTVVDKETLKKNADYVKALRGLRIISLAHESAGATGQVKASLKLIQPDRKTLTIEFRKAAEGYQGTVAGSDVPFIIDGNTYASIIEKAPRPASVQPNQPTKQP